MLAFSPETLEHDLAAIFRSADAAPRRTGNARVRQVAIALAILAPLGLTALHRIQEPQTAPIAVQTPPDQSFVSAYSANPALRAPQWAERQPFRAAPRTLVTGSAETKLATNAPSRKLASSRRRSEHQTTVAAMPAQERMQERMTLAQAMPPQEERKDEGIFTATEPDRVEVRAARLEAVDAIRTLRLR